MTAHKIRSYFTMIVSLPSDQPCLKPYILQSCLYFIFPPMAYIVYFSYICRQY